MRLTAVMNTPRTSGKRCRSALHGHGRIGLTVAALEIDLWL